MPQAILTRTAVLMETNRDSQVSEILEVLDLEGPSHKELDNTRSLTSMEVLAVA